MCLQSWYVLSLLPPNFGVNECLFVPECVCKISMEITDTFAPKFRCKLVSVCALVMVFGIVGRYGGLCRYVSAKSGPNLLPLLPPNFGVNACLFVSECVCKIEIQSVWKITVTFDPKFQCKIVSVCALVMVFRIAGRHDDLCLHVSAKLVSVCALVMVFGIVGLYGGLSAKSGSNLLSLLPPNFGVNERLFVLSVSAKSRFYRYDHYCQF